MFPTRKSSAISAPTTATDEADVSKANVVVSEATVQAIAVLTRESLLN